MNRGTRRMWARRMLRAGWLVAAVASWPRRAYYHFLTDEYGRFSPFQAFVAVIALCLLMGVRGCTSVVIRDNTTAKPAQVAEYLRDDPCMIEMMPRWMKKQARPLTVYDLDEGKKACKDAFEAHYARVEQQKVMIQLGGKK